MEDCFCLLHDAYVRAGFMKPDPSGMRATIYHALPTTTTLLAKYDGKIVGTISLIRGATHVTYASVKTMRHWRWCPFGTITGSLA